MNVEKQVGDVDLGLRGEVCGWVDEKLVAVGIQIVSPPPEAPGPSSILGLFSLGWRQEKILGEEEKALDPQPRAKARMENTGNGFHAGVTSHLCKVHSPQQTPESCHEPILSPGIFCFNQLILTVNPVGLQAGPHVPFLSWRLTLGTHAEKQCLSGFKPQDDASWSWLGVLGVMMDLGLLGVTV